MKVLSIMDFASGKIEIVEIDDPVIEENHDGEIDREIESRGHRVSDCYWMLTDKIDMEIHTLKR